MTLVFGLEGQEGCKVAANILYGFDCMKCVKEKVVIDQ